MIRRAMELLPDSISFSIDLLSEELKKEICEIRLRKDSVMSISTYRKNLMIDEKSKITYDINKAVKCSEKDINFVINKLCEGSVYRYTSSLCSGYIVTKHGIRAGIVGESVYENGKISTLVSFSSINIRIPHEIEGAGDKISAYLTKNPTASLLLVSPAGWGKTTVIRSVAKALSTGKFGKMRRIALIDERYEILPETVPSFIDRFAGYKKSDGIEIATRLFSPELIICDEIGYADDVEALLSVQNSGTPLLATTHGDSVKSALLRPNIKKLIENRVFTSFARIVREKDVFDIVFEEI